MGALMDWHRLLRLECGVRHYDWGERGGSDSPPYIARLLGVPVADRPFAELWMGDHPSMSAIVADVPGRPPLGQFIVDHAQQILGQEAARRGCRSLPFLLKVLSCDRPLSIQAHPDRQLAARLHRQDPAHYPDANHKPEMAIALSRFRALASFRPAHEIRADLGRTAAFQRFFDGIASDGSWLRKAYGRVFLEPQERVVETLHAALDDHATRDDLSIHDRLFRDCAGMYPHDAGALSVYFLNLVELKPGQALFVAANEPHAYLSGTIIECMAASDNVVRAGLTTKFVDAAVLLPMLTYAEGAGARVCPERLSPGLARYHTPVPEFSVDLLCSESTHVLEPGDRVSIVLLLSGQARLSVGAWSVEAKRGTVWLCPAACGPVQVEPLGGCQVQVVRAYPAGPWDPHD